MSEQDQSPNGAGGDAPPPQTEHLNIKVTDGNNEVFFKIKRSTQLKKLMDAFCERQGKDQKSVRFLFDGTRVNPEDSPDTVSTPTQSSWRGALCLASHALAPICGNFMLTLTQT
jgi:hypothetical protein